MLRRDTRVGAGIAVAVTAVHWLMGAAVHAPIVQPDELGYLDNARHLALGGVRPITGYYPGLSVVLAPVWKITQDPLTVWRTALFVNGACGGLTAFVVWWLVPVLAGHTMGYGRRVIVTLTVCAYPALLLYSNTALSESLFALVAAFVVLLAYRAATSTRVAPWVQLGLTAGLLVAVHPRGLAVAVAVLLVATVVLRPFVRTTPNRPAAWGQLIGVWGGATLGLAITRIALVAVRPASGTGLGNYRADEVVSRALGVGSVHQLLVGLAGQVFYLTVATAGLAPLGLVVGVLALRRVAAGDPSDVARAVAGLGALGVLAMSVLFLNGGDRADQLIYGRYNEGVVVALLVIAVVWLFGAKAGSARARRCVAWLATGVAGLGSGAAALQLGLSDADRRAPLNPATVLGVASLLRRSGPGIDVVVLLAVGAIALAVAVGVFLRFPRVAAVMLAMTFVAVSVDTLTGYFDPGSSARARQDVLAETISEAAAELHIPVSCVGYDAGIDFSYFNDRFYLPGWRVEAFNGRVGDLPCGPFAISSHPDFFSHYPGSQIVSVENDLTQILYVLPGPTLTRLQAAGWLLPAVIPGPLPASRQKAIVTASAVPHTVQSGKRTVVRISATNAGKGSPWPNLRALKADPYVVRITARWFKKGQRPTAPGQAGPSPIASSVMELPRTLLPGKKATVSLALIPRGPDGRLLPPGDYVIQVSVYQELVGVLPGGTVTFPITVRP